MNATMEMLNRAVLVRPDKPAEQSKGGIDLPAEAQEEIISGEVVAAEDAAPVSVGDRIFHRKFAGTEVTLDDERFLVVEEKDLLCRLR